MGAGPGEEGVILARTFHRARKRAQPFGEIVIARAVRLRRWLRISPGPIEQLQHPPCNEIQPVAERALFGVATLEIGKFCEVCRQRPHRPGQTQPIAAQLLPPITEFEAFQSAIGKAHTRVLRKIDNVLRRAL